MVEEKTSSLKGLNDKEIFVKEYEEEISYDIIRHAIKDWIEINDRRIPVIETSLRADDYLGAIKVRLGIGRFKYKVPTGLYAVGEVNDRSPVLITANYKLSFDKLRKELDERGFWILVLDTQGINVWCAAGKGTFSSRELIYQINKWNLKKIIKTRKLILPQLGATSMEPHLIRKHTGFKVIYGPVRSEDILRFIDQNYEADEEMRSVSFNLKERLVLTPIEVILNMKYIFILFLYFFILNMIRGTSGLLKVSLYNTLPFIIANFTGSLLFPLILSVVPFRSFSINGGLLGTLLGGYVLYNFEYFGYSENTYSKLGIFLLLIMLVSYISFNFTGSTTYTSFSGVKKETKIFLRIFILTVALGIISTIIGTFI